MMLLCGNCERLYKGFRDMYAGTSSWCYLGDGRFSFSCNCGESISFQSFGDKNLLQGHQQSLFGFLLDGSKIPYNPQLLYEVQAITWEELRPDILRKDPLFGAFLWSARTHAKSFVDLWNQLTSEEFSKELERACLLSYQVDMPYFSTEQFALDARLLGDVAVWLAGEVGADVNLDQLALGASLSNYGKLILAKLEPSLVQHIVLGVFSVDNGGSWEWQEQQRGIRHAIIGQIASSYWQLPKFVTECFEHYYLDKAQPPLIAVLTAAANQLTHVINLEDHLVDANIRDMAFQSLSIQTEEIEAKAKEYPWEAVG